MKTLFTNQNHANKGWAEGKRKLIRLFTRLTGYEIMFEESRKDLTPEKKLAILQTAKKEWLKLIK